jgi:hypothetical protein
VGNNGKKFLVGMVMADRKIFNSGHSDFGFLRRFLLFLASLPLLSCLIFVTVLLHVPLVVAVEVAHHWFGGRDINFSCINIHSIFTLGLLELSLWVSSSPCELSLEVGFVGSDLDVNEPVSLYNLSSCTLPFIQSDWEDRVD